MATPSTETDTAAAAQLRGPRPKRKDVRKAERLAQELQSLGEYSPTADSKAAFAILEAAAASHRTPNKSSRRKERKHRQQIELKAASSSSTSHAAPAHAATATATTATTATSSRPNPYPDGFTTPVPIPSRILATNYTDLTTTPLMGGIAEAVSPATSITSAAPAVGMTTTETKYTDGVAHTTITSTIDDEDSDGEGDNDDNHTEATNNGSSSSSGVVDIATQGIYPLVRNKKPKSKADRRPDSDHILLTDRFSSEEQKAAFEARVVEQGPAVSPFLKARLEREARKNWDMFYKRNTAKFFKDRHYIQREFNEIDEKHCSPGQRKRLVEVGCGCGNTLFPLIQDNPHLDFFGFDFAPRAVELLQERLDKQGISSSRCGLAVCDIATELFPPQVVDYDFATIMYVLSALEPDTMMPVLQKTFAALKPGGLVYMRDYALYDMTQLRFKKGSKISENFYMRWDGTRSYFFTTEHLRSLFEAAGFEVTFLGYISKVVRNIKLDTNMQRTWVQIKARKPLALPPSSSPSTAKA